jgi:hypothetical protein
MGRWSLCKLAMSRRQERDATEGATPAVRAGGEDLRERLDGEQEAAAGVNPARTVTHRVRDPLRANACA